jgi:cob(I)alamin adenosyltransferase
MPQGVPLAGSVPEDGLTTRQRRNQPVLAVHTGPGKGKSTAAFGMALRAWNQGFDVGVFQFVKSAKWHKMGEGWSWTRKKGSEVDHAAAAADGWTEIARRLSEETHRFYVLDEFTYPLKWGWVDVDEVVEVLRARPGNQHVVITGRDAPAALIDAADLVTEMAKVKHPMDAGRKGQRGIEW